MIQCGRTILLQWTRRRRLSFIWCPLGGAPLSRGVRPNYESRRNPDLRRIACGNSLGCDQVFAAVPEFED